MAPRKPTSPGERAKRENAKRQTIAIMGHQGMTLNAESLADMDLFAAGTISAKELLRRSDARVAAIVRRSQH